MQKTTRFVSITAMLISIVIGYSCMQRTAYTHTLEGFDYTLKNITPVAADGESRKTYARLTESMQQLITMKSED